MPEFSQTSSTLSYNKRQEECILFYIDVVRSLCQRVGILCRVEYGTKARLVALKFSTYV